MLLLKKDIKRILRGLNSFILFFFKMHSEQLILLEAQQSRVSQFIFPLDQKSFFLFTDEDYFVYSYFEKYIDLLYMITTLFLRDR